jgi:hypothetical protein
MKVWHAFDRKSYKVLSFIGVVGSDDGHDMITAVSSLFTALWPVVRPLTVSLYMAAKQPGSSVFDKNIQVPVKSWYLYEMDPPARVDISKYTESELANQSDRRREGIPELTPQALTDWLTRAYAQQLPEGYVPILRSLDMNHARACLLQDQEPHIELAYRWGHGSCCEIYSIPVEKREDGFWVSGPIRGMTNLNHPPIAIELYTYEEFRNIDLSIQIFWSPWIEEGSAEEDLLWDCLCELEKRGWKLMDSDTVFMAW